MQRTPLLILVGIVAIILLVWYFDSHTETATEVTSETSLVPEVNEELVVRDEHETGTEVPTEEVEAAEAVDTTVTGEPSSQPVVSLSGLYTEYSPRALENAADGRIVLFFRASWCPSCRALDADITAKQSTLPADVNILTVDFDAETELKAKYGVTNRHTLVQIDGNGEMIKKWSGSPRLENILAEI